MSAVTLEYADVAEDLRPFLSVYYEFRADVPVFEDVERADLAQFRFIMEGTEASYTFSDGVTLPAPRIQILGPSTGKTISRVNGPVHLFGAGVLPAGWGALLDFEASLLVNRVVDAAALFGDRLYGVMDALRDAATLDQKVVIANDLGRELAQRGETAAFDFTRIVDEWLVSSPSPQIDALVTACGLSRRQVERNCNRFYGSPPKVLARKYRALRAAIALAKGEATTEELVGSFYDQSHFIREIKQFTGVTPGRIVEDLPLLAKLTLKRTEMKAASPLITRT